MLFFFFIMISEENIFVDCSKKYLLLKFTTEPTKNYLINTIHCTGGGDENHLQEKEMQKGKMVSEESLKIAEKRRELKSKGKKERYTH